MAPKKDSKFKDYIDFKPEVVIHVNAKQTKLIEKYYPIIKALREKPMTVKDVHDLYFDEETKKHEYTIKTIYRYIDELEAAGLVSVAGHRVTKGSRVLEKLYSRTASIFFKKMDQMDEEYKKHKSEYYQKATKSLASILKILYEKPNISLEDIQEVLFAIYKKRHSKTENIMSRVEKNPELAKIYSTISIDEINYMNSDLGMMMTLMAEPELLEKLKKFLS